MADWLDNLFDNFEMKRLARETEKAILAGPARVDHGPFGVISLARSDHMHSHGIGATNWPGSVGGGNYNDGTSISREDVFQNADINLRTYPLPWPSVLCSWPNGF